MLTFFAAGGLLILVTATVMAVLMLARPRDPQHLIWGVFCILVALWGLGSYNIGSTEDPGEALFWWRIAYMGIIFIPAMFTHFVYTFLGKKKDWIIAVLYAFSFFLLYENIQGAFIAGTYPIVGLQYLAPNPLYDVFMLLWVVLILYAHVVLGLAYRSAEKVRKQQIEYFFFGSFVGFLGGSTSFLPVYGFDWYPYGNAAVALYPIIMGYAILKYRLMNLKLIATQIFIVLLWAFIFARAAFAPSGSGEQIADGVLLAMTIIVGILLIRSVSREVESREKLQRQEKELERVNARLREIDREKTEFVSIASHQLRSPLTAIKGYASMVLEGSYGPVFGEMKGALERIYNSSELMASSVQDFLDVSRIEQGRMRYEFKPVELGKIVRTAVEELQTVAHKKGLTLTYKSHGEPFMVMGDMGKLKQVFSNLVDNSLKYTPHGTVDVTVAHGQGIVRVEIRDTGCGMSTETLGKIFDKFVRADNANHVNVSGTGLGLYVAREFVKAHKGKISAESDGENKGSRFTVELPALTN